MPSTDQAFVAKIRDQIEFLQNEEYRSPASPRRGCSGGTTSSSSTDAAARW
jgi:hypothetical protein